MIVRGLIALCAALGMSMGVTFAQSADTQPNAGDQAVQVDLSSPKATMRTYLVAMNRGDVAAAKQAVIGNEAQLRAIDAAGEMIKSWNRLGDATAKRKEFNVQGGQAEALQQLGISQQQRLEQELRRLEESEVTIDGDRATVQGKAGSNAGPPAVLRRQAGDWRVDLGAMPQGNEAERVAVLMLALSQVADEIAREIDAGQYKTIDEVRDAFGARTAEAIKPYLATAPTTQPQGAQQGSGR